MDAIAGLLDGPRARRAFLLRCTMDPPWALHIRDEAPLSLVAMLRGRACFAFGGAFVLTLVAGIANRGTPALPPIAVAFGLYLVAVIITIAVNVPLNDALKAAGDPAHIDVAQVRAQFNEARWAAWNLVRVAASVPAFGLLAWALVLCGRANP